MCRTGPRWRVWAGIRPWRRSPRGRRAARRSTPSSHGQEFPLAEPGMLTFAWRGPAERVHLVRWIHGGGDRLPFVQLAGTDLWLLRVPVEDGGRFEYKLAIGLHGQERLIVDPLEPGAGGRSVRGELGRAHPGLRAAGMEPAARGAGGADRDDRRREPGLRRGARGARLSAGGARSAAELSAGGGARRRRLRHLCRPAGGARQPDGGGRDPAGDRGAGADARPPGRIFRRPAAFGVPGRRPPAGARRALARSRRRRGSGCCSARASGRWPRWSRRSAIPASSAGWC